MVQDTFHITSREKIFVCCNSRTYSLTQMALSIYCLGIPIKAQ